MNALEKIHLGLGITQEHLKACRLPSSEEPSLSELEVVEIDFDGRPFLLTFAAGEAWRKMKNAALADGIELVPISGFRSYVYQKQIIERKLARGVELATILTETAIPGYSEHHTGRAIDLSSDGKFELTQEFETTAAYQWLTAHASRFQFAMTYPRDNPYGIIFEPWHWCFQA